MENKMGEIVRGPSHSSAGHQGRLLKGWIFFFITSKQKLVTEICMYDHGSTCESWTPMQTNSKVSAIRRASKAGFSMRDGQWRCSLLPLQHLFLFQSNTKPIIQCHQEGEKTPTLTQQQRHPRTRPPTRFLLNALYSHSEVKNYDCAESFCNPFVKKLNSQFCSAFKKGKLNGSKSTWSKFSKL